MSLKVLIPTWWKWVALGDITKFINKSLVKIWKKPALSYIIESYPDDTEFVITMWYCGNQVKDFLRLVYPEKKIQIVEVDRHEWEWSSVLHSMLQAKDYLQLPFIYHACDTVVLDPIRNTDVNWIGGYRDQWSNNYAGFNVIWKNVEQIFDKWIIDPDFIHIGLVQIQDYQSFWSILEAIYRTDPNNQGLNDVMVLNQMIADWKHFEVSEFKQWFDTGNVDGLSKARKEIPDSFHILDKLEESIYIYDDFVVKFFYDQKLSDKRVERAKILDGLVPKIEWHERNFFRYKFAKWKLYSRSANPNNFIDFLSWSKDNLWKETDEVSSEEFRARCYDFYYTKSIQRIEKLMNNHLLKDEEDVINGERVPTIKEIFTKIDFDWLCNSRQTLFHGDFILDNIIQNPEGFCLLDWRQDFWWLLRSGDMYYDLAKLNHNLTVNHDIVNADLFHIEKDENGINVDIYRRENLVQCQRVLHGFVSKEWFDLKKMKVLTAIIWLNMSPLHHHPFDKFLFYFWKLNLWRALNEVK